MQGVGGHSGQRRLLTPDLYPPHALTSFGVMLRWPAGMIVGIFAFLFVAIGLLNRIMVGSVMAATCIVMWGGLLLYGCKVLITAMMADMDPPHWPEVGIQTHEELPLWRVLLAVAICLTPFVVVTLWLAMQQGNARLVLAMVYTIWPTQLITGDAWDTFAFRGWSWWGMLALLPGLVYLPAAVLAAAVRDDARGYWPPLVVRTILRGGAGYAVCLMPMAMYAALAGMLGLLLGVIGPLIAGAILDAALPYLVLVQFRMIGLLHAFYEPELELLA